MKRFWPCASKVPPAVVAREVAVGRQHRTPVVSRLGREPMYEQALQLVCASERIAFPRSRPAYPAPFSTVVI
jgi:hypothetical protein